jgi:hypothetical protein
MILRAFLSSLPATVLLTGAVLKALDFDGFLEKALYYRALDLFWIRLSALSTIFVEVILGVLLLFRIWLVPFTIPICIALFLFFTGLIAWAWHAYGIEDCGCFGSFIETPPWISLGKNILLASMLGVLFFLERARRRRDSKESLQTQEIQRAERFLKASNWIALGVLGVALSWTFFTLKPQV